MGNAKIRLDELLIKRGLFENLTLAQRMVMAGQVRVNGQVQINPSFRASADAGLMIDELPRFVSRGGEKIEPALQEFSLQNLQGMVCADVGSSTGGFTDCLLQNGAEKVFAIDVGYGILHWKLRNDERVVVMERTNARYVTALPEPVNLVTIDASFISLRVLLPVIRNWFGAAGGSVIALIKPQFEARKKDAAIHDGVIRDAHVHAIVLEEIMAFVQTAGYSIAGLIQSPIQGPKGNIEFFALLHYPQQPAGIDVGAVISRLIANIDSHY